MMHVMALVLAAAQPAPPIETGVDAAATATVRTMPATYDLAGFRLGMTEAQAEQVLRQRGMKVRRRTRGRTFEDSVRALVSLRGGRLAPKGGSVLDSADIDDGRGGRIAIRMLAWPDGARIRGITYLPPAGTGPAEWRTLLAGRYGAPARDGDAIDGSELHARWCGRAACLGESGLFRLTADVGSSGGQITLSQPEGTSRRLTGLVEAEATRIAPRQPPAF